MTARGAATDVQWVFTDFVVKLNPREKKYGSVEF
jgi:hypothetical protein